jgi:two-component system response regulator DctR
VQLRSRFGRLSEREQEICDLIVEGLPNKVIAGRLNLALRTVENHRAAIFQKMEVESLAQLVRLTVELTSPALE